MSVAEQAEQEAENRWPAGGELPDMLYPRVAVRDIMRGSFVAGAEWQASCEPTEAQIEAAAKVLFDGFNDTKAKFANVPSMIQRMYIIKAQNALTAARKAVKGDE